MPRGNPDNLRTAAQRKRTDATRRAEQAINALVRDGAPVNFRAIARLAGCSPDFLYRTVELRARIERLRQTPPAPRPRAPEHREHSTSSVVRELTAQLAEEKRQRREEVTQLRDALTTAHGELLELRRRLKPIAPAARPEPDPSS